MHPRLLLSKQELKDCRDELAAALSDELVTAIELLAQWEGMDFASFCRAGIICMMESSWDDMQTIWSFPFDSQQEGLLRLPSNYADQKQWARKFYDNILDLMRAIGTKTVASSHIPNEMPDRPFSEPDEEREARERHNAKVLFQTLPRTSKSN